MDEISLLFKLNDKKLIKNLNNDMLNIIAISKRKKIEDLIFQSKEKKLKNGITEKEKKKSDNLKKKYFN